MHWKARLDHLIADGEQATYLESREILDTLLAHPAEDRWQLILARDPRLERLVPTDYQWLLKATAVLRSEEVTDALAKESSRWDERWRQHSDHLTTVIQVALARLRLFLLVFSLGLIVVFAARSDSGLTSAPSNTGPSPEAFTRAVESLEALQAHWNATLGQHPQERMQGDGGGGVSSAATPLPLPPAQSPAPTFAPAAAHTGVPAGVWVLLWLLLAVVTVWVVSHSKVGRRHWRRFGHPFHSKGGAMVGLSTHQWGERLEKRSADLMDALESSQTQISTRLDRVLRETAERQERQREFLWRVMAMEELGLNLIEGKAFHAELAALRAMWGESEILAELDPVAARGIPGRPLLLVTLEQLYGDLLIQCEEEEQVRSPLWSAWLPQQWRNHRRARNHTEHVNKRIARALEELRRGNWDAGLDELSGIDYLPVRRWMDTTRDRIDLEQWYAELRQELWAAHAGPRAKAHGPHQCAKTCRIPFCKPGKLCLRQLVSRFKKD